MCNITPSFLDRLGCVQVPALSIFETSYKRGKFDKSRQLSNGSLLEFTHIYPMDAVFDRAADVPEDVGTISLNPPPPPRPLSHHRSTFF